MTTQYDNIIAIDPDVSFSGVAYLHPSTKTLEVSKMSFPKLLDYLRSTKAEVDSKGESLIVVVEASWVSKANWHLSQWERNQRSAAKGYDVGRNHETGRKIVEMCGHFSIEFFEHSPLRKCWRGANGKITHGELASFTGISCRTNQDMRDAALLAWHFSGLPIRVRV